LLVEISSEIFSDEMKKLQSLRREIEGEIYQLLGLEVEVKIVESRTLSGREGGGCRVIDNRNPGE